MRKHLYGASDAAEVNMTPMLDVVFILLIFFIVTATFLDERGLQLITPPSSDPPLQDVQLQPILVQIDQNNSIYINGRLTDIARVDAAIERLNVDNSGRSAVVIQPDPDAEHGVVTRVYDSARTTRVLDVVVREPARQST